ncbi:Uncharacterised protein [Mycobacterium tuberculosis]|nr:Uncharacterised protein [Mycobacterium tuberculosis]CKV02445.1 Uncharacterised protein [Mycobacterium tuberculosis]
MLLSRRRFTFTVGISPPVKPMTNSRPPAASERSESVNRSPPTGSTTMSTPRPFVSSCTASLNPSANTTSVAPATVASSAFSCVLTTATVRDAPSAGASRNVDVPIPPAAPCTSTVSPACSRPRTASAKYTVRSLNSTPAPASKVMLSGSLNTRSGDNTATSAMPPVSIVRPTTLSPERTWLLSGADRTTPAISAPSTNGGSGRYW